MTLIRDILVDLRKTCTGHPRQIGCPLLFFLSGMRNRLYMLHLYHIMWCMDTYFTTSTTEDSVLRITYLLQLVDRFVFWFVVVAPANKCTVEYVGF
jgi:hypothetical protein